MGAQGGTGILHLPLGRLGSLPGGEGLLPSLTVSRMQSELASPSTTHQAALFPGSPAPMSSSWSGKVGQEQRQSGSWVHHRSHIPYSRLQRASAAAAHQAPPWQLCRKPPVMAPVLGPSRGVPGTCCMCLVCEHRGEERKRERERDTYELKRNLTTLMKYF